MEFTVLLLFLLPFSKGCLRTHTDPPPCSTCSETLGNTNLLDGQCDVHRTCVSCTQTQVVYSRSGQCLIASVTCPSSVTSPKVRLLKTDNSYTDIPYNNAALRLACDSGVSWRYSDSTVGTISNIKKAICFGNVPGFQESPIALNTASSVHTSLYNASQFKVSYGTGIIDHIEVHKNVMSAFHARMHPDAAAFFTASHLDARYRLVEYHGHWNKDPSMRGSEHTLDGRFYNAEFHFVHIREDFATFSEAEGADGVAVIAVFAQLGDNNPLLDPLITALENFLNTGATTGNVAAGEPVLLQDPAVLMPADHSYFAYTGSLTTGQFTKCVSWNVLRMPITISQRQLDVLGMVVPDNVRDVQGKDPGTTVYTSYVINNRRPIVEEEEEISEKEEERETDTVESPSFVQKEEEEEEEDLLEGIELSQEELEFLHRLRQKYINRKSQLRTKLLEWTR